MQLPGILAILEYLEPFHNYIQTHIQNPAILTGIGRPSVTMEIENPGTLSILEYSEAWHTSNLTHFQNPAKDLRWSIKQK